MNILPAVPRRVNKRSHVQVQMLGINMTDNYRLGELSDSEHISSSHFPYISTPDLPVREYKLNYEFVGVTEERDCVWVYCYGNKVLYLVRRGTEYLLYYQDVSEKPFSAAEEDGTFIMNLTEIPTSTALLDNRLVLWPSKKVITLSDMTAWNMENEVRLTGCTVSASKIVYEDMISLEDGPSLLYEDDWVELECTESSINGSYTIKSIDPDSKTIEFTDESFAAVEGEVTVILTRTVPEMTCICEYGNRVWGSDGKKIFSSKQGNPFNMMDYSGLADSAYFVDTIGGDEILACQKMGSACCFFGRKAMHKVVGNFPAEYQLYTYSVDGIVDPDSLSCVNDVIFYAGHAGINMYSGGTPQLFFPLGQDALEITDIHAGTDGVNYYFSVTKADGKSAFYMLDLEHGICILLDHIYMQYMSRTDNYLYYIAKDGDHYRLNEIPRKAYIPETKEDFRDYVYGGDWMLEMKPIYEQVSSARANTFKRYHKLIFRIDLGELSSLKIEISEDGNPWHTVHLEAGGKSGVRPVIVPIGRCDEFRVRLSGTGACTVMNMERIFSLGAER